MRQYVIMIGPFHEGGASVVESLSKESREHAHKVKERNAQKLRGTYNVFIDFSIGLNSVLRARGVTSVLTQANRSHLLLLQA